MNDPRYELRIEKFMTLPPTPGAVVVVKHGNPVASFSIEQVRTVVREWDALEAARFPVADGDKS